MNTATDPINSRGRRLSMRTALRVLICAGLALAITDLATKTIFDSVGPSSHPQAISTASLPTKASFQRVVSVAIP